MNKTIIRVFITIEAFLYIIFVCLDITDKVPDTVAVLKYASILICVLFSILSVINIDKNVGLTGTALICAALIFTAISDRFLLFGDVFLPGLICFCIVQMIHLVIITGISIKRILTAVLLRIIASAIGTVILAGIIPDEKVLIAIVMFYGFSFFGNILHLAAGLAVSKNEVHCLASRPYLYLCGMILFLLCDINVLLYNLGKFIDIGSSFKKVANVASILIWIFYLPSQVMIVLSGRNSQESQGF
ncbi:MAG: hypothetical protein K6E85_13290 [Lachnospiraceae bacterium]|nr:hypothetical protein [Lachnospiraceae bacterium]